MPSHQLPPSSSQQTDQPPLSLDLWFIPNQNVLPLLQKRGETLIGRLTEGQWLRLLANRPEIPVYGGRYVARPTQSL